MKKLLFLLLAVPIFIPLVWASEATHIFNNTTGNNLTVRPGFNTLFFDGATTGNDSVRVPTNINNQWYQSTSYSVEVWFKPMGLGEATDGWIVCKGDNASNGWLINISEINTLRLILYASGGAKTTTAYQAGTLIGVWNHIVWTWANGAAPKVYINGTEASYSGNEAATTPANDTSYALFIGANALEGSRVGDEYIRRVRVWKNKELAQVDVDALYGGGTFVDRQPSPVSGTTAEYNFINGSGTTLSDTFGVDGTLYNALTPNANGPIWVMDSQ